MGEATQTDVFPRFWLLLVAFVAMATLLSLPPPEGMPEASKQAAVVGAFMALLWVSELLPLAATALVPLAAFPLTGIAPLEKTAEAYAQPLIFLFLGGFMLGAAIERWKLHHRLAHLAVKLSGRRPDMLVLGMMSATAFLSLWVSNTATAMVMVPIAASLLGSSNPESGNAEDKGDPFGSALMLGIAFAATIGGMGSLIGTPPNALFAGYMQRTYGMTIGFGQWMLIGIPLVLVLLPVTWLLLTRIAFRLPKTELPPMTFHAISDPMSRNQWTVAGVLVLAALGWITRPFLASSLGHLPLSDAGIAIAAVLVLFAIPAGAGSSRALLEWNDVKGIRWDVLILFGGGLALADAVSNTGLAGWIGTQLSGLSAFPLLLVILVIMFVTVYLGELASNTAVAAIFLPVAGAAAAGLGASPIDIALPVALAASLGFMLPVATPPNAIVYGTGAVSARQMLKAGAVLDVVSILIVYAIAVFLGPLVFGGP